MTDRLTDDDLAAIAAHFEELINLGISGHTDTWKRQKLLAMEMSENDVPRLLAHIRAQDAELARLREALEQYADTTNWDNWDKYENCIWSGSDEGPAAARRVLNASDDD
jgi:cytochrome c553